jgi:branched-chain amino acid transport system ATP-binding protein
VTDAPLLDARSVRKEFGGLVACDDIDFTVDRGAIVSLIGPNGAGKTTFFNILTGAEAPTAGEILFDGRDIVGLPRHKITALGISRTFQNIRLFGAMTALENVLVGLHVELNGGLFRSLFRTPLQRREEREGRAQARELLAYCGLPARAEQQYARHLAYGDQRRVEVGRALATNPKLLLLDEPTAGMNPRESLAFVEFVRKARQDRGLTVLLIEHDMRVVVDVSERVTVLHYGKKIAEGTPDEVTADEGVRTAYLGTKAPRVSGAHETREDAAEAAADGAQPLLVLEDVHVYYGSIHALKGVSLRVDPGEIVTLIGANGAGKSTTLRTISGLLRTRKGSMRFAGNDIVRASSQSIVGLGIAQAPEGRQLFSRMTVLENLEMGAFQRRDRHEIAPDLERVYELFPRLAERQAQKAGTLSGGEQQMCAIGRALLARPRLLMLDEPSMGLSPNLVDRIFEVIADINQQGTTILLVEQNAARALEIAHRGYVLETGRVTLADDAAALRSNERVRASYLGEA